METNKIMPALTVRESSLTPTKKPVAKEESVKSEDKVEISPVKDYIKSAKAGAKPPVSEPKKETSDGVKSFIGGGLGVAFLMGLETSGAETILHEGAHAKTLQLMFDNAHPTVQVDAIDNLQAFLKDPSKENLSRFLSGYDVNQDGALGVTSLDTGTGLSKTGKVLGENKAIAVVAAAGSVAQEIPALAGFALGYKMRKEHPMLGYMLMTTGTLSHLSNSLYPLSAVAMPTDYVPDGHDWKMFAQLTGIPPAVTAGLFFLSLPALAAGLHYMEKREEDKLQDRQALGKLIAKGAISEAEITKEFENYKGKDKINQLEEKFYELLKTDPKKVDDKFKKEFLKVTKDLNKEYGKFSDVLVEKHKEEVEKEHGKPKESTIIFSPTKILQNAAADFKKEYDKDKWNAVLEGLATTGSALVGFKLVFDAIKSVAPGVTPALTGTAARVAGSLIPGVGILGALSTGYKAVKVIANPQASKEDKVVAGSVAAFSAVGAAGAMIPGLGLPLALVSIGGIVGTYAVKWAADKIREHL
jgi:hypothetical protein